MEKTRFFASLLSALTVIAFVTLAAGQTSVPLQINYQGELKSPTTGEPVRDGDYDMVFEIFTEQTRGVSLWQGQHTDANRNPVEIKNGIFNVILGSGAGNDLAASVFNGSERWLQITIEGETLKPRQKITSVAYSIVADNSRLLDGMSASEFLTPSQGDTLYLSLTDNDSFVAGRGARADHQGAFVWADSTGDSLASRADDEFRVRATGGVNFEVGDNAFRVAGDFDINGELHANKIVYFSPRTHYYSVAPEDFVPGNSYSEYRSHGSLVGAYIYSGNGTLVAPVHLPHGAVVTEFKVFFADNSVSKITVRLREYWLSVPGYRQLAALDSSGISGFGSKTETSISDAIINNEFWVYLLSADANPWDGNTMRVMGAVITYTISEAP
ncbi:hypothetical protein HQ563_10530 [bacterium]|nr:hypothetical protein [bacterium]